jgi:protein gp37
MSDRTNIQWCDSTFNPWMGCTKVSPACDHCYAERDTARFKQVNWGVGQPRKRTSPENWRKPIQWNKRPFYECSSCGWRDEVFCNGWIDAHTCPECKHSTLKSARRRVFCASLADVFDNEVDPQWRLELFNLIASTPNLDWLILTKRVGNVLPMLEEIANLGLSEDNLSSEPVRTPGHWLANDWLRHDMPPKNVWLGITVCNQHEVDRDIQKLWLIPAEVRWISIEPMLESINLSMPLGLSIALDKKQDRMVHTPNCLPLINWVVVGGESGPGARKMDVDWARQLRDQCATARVPFFMKQLGGERNKKGDIVDLPEDLQIRQSPSQSCSEI